MTRSAVDKDNIRRVLLRQVRDVLRTFRRQLRRLFTDPRAVIDYARYRRAIRRHDWAGLQKMLRPLSKAAKAAKDRRLLVELGQAALRLDEHQLGVELLQAARDAAPPLTADGKIADTLIIRLMESESQGVGVGMPLSGYIRAAAKRADRTILLVEPRMVPLFQRTLPDIVVLPFDADLAPHVEGSVTHAGINELRLMFGFDAATIARFHLPLAADRTEAEKMRSAYLRGRSASLIGLSWWSSHYGKDLPTLSHWSQLVAAFPAQFVSLQYGNVDNDIAVLRGGDPSRLLVDSSVDQLVDMDRFASQIAALDLVITISNSGAHLAGSLGQRMILVRDDLFRRNWPYLSRKVPWYPGATVVGRDDRPWDAVFEDVAASARAMLAAPRSR